MAFEEVSVQIAHVEVINIMSEISDSSNTSHEKYANRPTPLP